MGNCIICFDEPIVYIPMPDDEIYTTPDNGFVTTFGTIPEIVPSNESVR